MQRERTTVFALFTLSVAVLAFELTQIRIFAFSLHPVIAYSAIALAMLGFGLGATVLALRPALGGPRPERRIGLLAVLLAAAIVLVNLLFARTSNRIIPQGTLDVDPLWMALVLLPCAVPYFLGGLATALIFQAGVARIGRLYFWNLLGSAVGCIGMIVLLRPLGAERLLLLTAALAAVAGVVLALADRGVLFFAAAGTAVACLGLLPLGRLAFPFHPDVNSHNQLFEAKEEQAGFPPPVNEHTEWDPIGRIDIQRHTRPHIEVSEPIGYRVVTIDGGAMTLMLEEAGVPGTWGEALFGESMYAAAYQIRKQPEVLVIGSGGGSDIETALFWQARRVTGVEISLSTLRAVTGPYADFVGWPERKEVAVHHGDGRSFAKSTAERFDIIQLSGVDTMTMHTSGSTMVAAEDYLYTVDAFVDFLKILKPNGVLSVMRFGDQAMNLSTVAAIALRELGVGAPQRQIVALRQANMAGILVKLEPFQPREIEALRRFTARRADTPVSIPIYESANVRLGAPIQLLHPEGVSPAPRYTLFFTAMALGEERSALARLGNAFVIPTDDKPYYILGTFFEAMRRGEKPHPALGLLLTSTVIIGLASLVLILLPAGSVRRRGGGAPGSLFLVLAYFFAIGVGFMLLEVGLIHKATVFVSTPGAAVAVVLSAILVSSALGARTTDLVRLGPSARIGIAAAGLLVLSLIYRLGVGPLFDALYGLPVIARCLVAALSIAPAGFFMGWFFPTGLGAVSERTPAAVPWAIAVNSFASVVGSLATLFIGVMVGLTGVFVVALVGYALAAAALLAFVRRVPKEGP